MTIALLGSSQNRSPCRVHSPGQPHPSPLCLHASCFWRRDVAQAIWHLGVSQSRAKALFAGTIMSTILQLVMIILLGIQVGGRSGD